MNRKRWIILWDYPGCPFKINDIIEDYGNGMCHGIIYSPKYILLDDVLKYKHIFLEVDWWEYKKIEELPSYLKDKYNNHFKVIRHHSGLDKTIVRTYNGKIEQRLSYDGLLPSTYEEYNNFIKKQKI